MNERTHAHKAGIAADIDELVGTVAQRAAGSAVKARHRAHSALTNARTGVWAAGRAAIDNTCARARAADEYIHDSPWRFIGAAILVGTAIGFVLTRR